MKRRKLINYLLESGCFLAREGSDHSVFEHAVSRRKATVPRHVELNDFLAEKICKQLGLPKIKRAK